MIMINTFFKILIFNTLIGSKIFWHAVCLVLNVFNLKPFDYEKTTIFICKFSAR